MLCLPSIDKISLGRLRAHFFRADTQLHFLSYVFLPVSLTAQGDRRVSTGEEPGGKQPMDQQDTALVAMALAGYTEERNDLWRCTCASLVSRLGNPYLRMMFTFLSLQGGDFDPILVSVVQGFISFRI